MAQTAFFAIYDVVNARTLCFFPGASELLQALFTHWAEHFRGPNNGEAPMWTRYVSMYSNNIHMRDALRRQTASSATSQVRRCS
jgi:hypothetical protein